MRKSLNRKGQAGITYITDRKHKELNQLFMSCLLLLSKVDTKRTHPYRVCYNTLPKKIDITPFAGRICNRYCIRRKLYATIII